MKKGVNLRNGAQLYNKVQAQMIKKSGKTKRGLISHWRRSNQLAQNNHRHNLRLSVIEFRAFCLQCFEKPR